MSNDYLSLFSTFILGVGGMFAAMKLKGSEAKKLDVEAMNSLVQMATSLTENINSKYLDEKAENKILYLNFTEMRDKFEDAMIEIRELRKHVESLEKQLSIYQSQNT